MKKQHNNFFLNVRNKIADLHYIFRFNGYIYALNTKVTASLTPLMHILLIEFLKSCYLSTMNRNVCGSQSVCQYLNELPWLVEILH
ncbi:Protein of unknown function [Gryllus bimaculatus]|nr:Protein of unknown function [Gryllus bimaculatus]